MKFSMSNKIRSVVKFKIKSGCEEEFLAAHNFTNEHKSPFLSFRAIRVDGKLVVHIAEYENIEKVFAAQDQGLDWLTSIEHLIEYYHDSRTEAFSGIQIYRH